MLIRGKIQLPEFQRDWTWDDDCIRGIIANLLQGYPMGCNYNTEILILNLNTKLLIE